ncbi:MAG: DUF4397 domain-containing protein [Chloroflexi bacterium]|nr:DUF4397 domain-containing protein [Chloroflexota bacterium]
MLPIKPIIRTMVFLLLLALVLPALAQPTPPINLAHLRVVNALVGLGPVDVYLDGARVAFALEPEAATPYFAVPAGRHSLSVRPPDSDPLSAPVADVLVDLAPNQSETAIAYQKQFATEGFTPQYEQTGAFYVMDDDRSPLELGKARLTAVHLAVGSPPVISIAYPSRESLLHQVALEQPYGTVDIAAHLYSLALVDAVSPDLTVLARLGDFSVYASTLYTIVVVPDMQPVISQTTGQPAVQAAVPQPRAFIISAPVDPPPDGLRLRLVHAAPNTAVLDLYIDGRLVAERMNYSRVTEYLGLKSYSHVITLRRVGAGPQSTPLGQAEFTITEDNRRQTNWTLLLLNAAGGDTSAALELEGSTETARQTIVNTPGGSLFMVLLPDNIAQTQPGYARVRLINAVNDIPPLRLIAPVVPTPAPLTPVPTLRPNVPTATPRPPQQLVDDAIFGADASEAEVPAGLYPTLNFIPAGLNTNLSTLRNVQLVNGMVYTFVVMGSPIGNPPVSVAELSDYGSGVPLSRLYLGRVIAETARVRNNPSAQASVIAQLPQTTEVEVLGRDLNGEWIRVRYVDANTGARGEGWISGTANILAITRLGVPVSPLALPRYVAPGG